MTKPEAKALAARLVKIWEPESPGDIEVGVYQRVFSFVTRSRRMGMMCRASIESIPPRSCAVYSCWLFPDAQIEDANVRETRPYLSMNADRAAIYLANFYASDLDTRQFERDCLPFFRRGCWLSGVPIEATAHEKLEWLLEIRESGMLTDEELETWNLKF